MSPQVDAGLQGWRLEHVAPGFGFMVSSRAAPRQQATGRTRGSNRRDPNSRHAAKSSSSSCGRTTEDDRRTGAIDLLFADLEARNAESGNTGGQSPIRQSFRLPTPPRPPGG